jgi:cytochrome c
VIRARGAGFLVLALLLCPFLAAGADPVRGEWVFQRCYACHSVLADEDRLPGPSLRCVLGRRAGTVPGFEFSPAMIAAGAMHGLVWTRATLDAFLLDPPSLVPGTTMWIPGLTASEDRQDVIDYLERKDACPVDPPSPRMRP